ncbi:MAG: hypothetical protein KKF77_05410 [Proteobacteria bacterium]|nr:hypothetical protein [Pseudomonadota bacterium]
MPRHCILHHMSGMALRSEVFHAPTFCVSLLICVLACFGCAITSRCVSGDCVNGQGTQTFSGGGKFAGEFKDDKPNGQGERTFPDGWKYVGEIKDDKKDWPGDEVKSFCLPACSLYVFSPG